MRLIKFKYVYLKLLQCVYLADSLGMFNSEVVEWRSGGREHIF